MQGGKSFNLVLVDYPTKEREYITYSHAQRYEHKVDNKRAIERGEYNSIALARAAARRSAMNSARRAKHVLSDIVRSNKWDYWVTLSYNPEKINSFDRKEVLKSIKTFFRYCESRDKAFKAVVVLEKHRLGRFHAHALVGCSDDSKLVLYDSGHIRQGKSVLKSEYWEVKYGFSHFVKIAGEDNSRILAYILKYIQKSFLEDNEKGVHRYLYTKSCDRPSRKRYLVNLDNMDFSEADSHKTIEREFLDYKLLMNIYDFASDNEQSVNIPDRDEA